MLDFIVDFLTFIRRCYNELMRSDTEAQIERNLTHDQMDAVRRLKRFHWMHSAGVIDKLTLHVSSTQLFKDNKLSTAWEENEEHSLCLGRESSASTSSKKNGNIYYYFLFLSWHTVSKRLFVLGLSSKPADRFSRLNRLSRLIRLS